MTEEIDEILKCLADNKSFIVHAGFAVLLEMGFTRDNNPYEIDPQHRRNYRNVGRIVEASEHYEIVEFDYSFHKITGNEVIELYFNQCYQSYGQKGKEIYYLSLKGTYNLDDLALIPSKKPSVTAYNCYGQPTLMITIRGPETEWYITHYESKCDYFGKFFDSDLYFGLSRVDYDADNYTISDVYYKIGEKKITAVELAEIVPALKNCSYLKLLNWKKYVTADHITLLEMSLI